jgi:hypothetical protein
MGMRMIPENGAADLIGRCFRMPGVEIRQIATQKISIKTNTYDFPSIVGPHHELNVRGLFTGVARLRSASPSNGGRIVDKLPAARLRRQGLSAR